MRATCIPRHMPKYGFFQILARCAACAFPLMPLSPNPPGTRIPSHLRNCSSVSDSRCPDPSSSVASIHLTSSFLVSCTAAWCRAQTKDWYASSPPLMYLPTTPMISGLDACASSTFEANFPHLALSQTVSMRSFEACSNSKVLSSILMMRCSAKTRTTWKRFFWSCALMILFDAMLHWLAIFLRVPSSSSWAQRHTTKSAWMPAASSALTEC
mmetsp:Transcript_15519/g.35498  ORF Transcript_15519/g.35498 Transcript_15519/m.35498 type:complete len:212 (+) Transcript_15519:819-1454(+)